MPEKLIWPPVKPEDIETLKLIAAGIRTDDTTQADADWLEAFAERISRLAY